MSQLLEYTTHHPFLVSATAILAVLALVFELRHRRSGGSSVSTLQAVHLLNTGALALDTRPREAYEQGHLIEARHLPGTELGTAAETLKKYREKPVLVYCDNGMSSAAAVRTLRSQGFTKAVSLRGGINGWRQENLPLVKDSGKGKREGK
ncbi:MAG TPA: rhodanese-like domain-containing protein [Steroidobacteraceae bacterium]|nr:rhodanese-like domain-containing protein [Steroidobacteraceae bacterium]